MEVAEVMCSRQLAVTQSNGTSLDRCHHLCQLHFQTHDEYLKLVLKLQNRVGCIPFHWLRTCKCCVCSLLCCCGDVAKKATNADLNLDICLPDKNANCFEADLQDEEQSWPLVQLLWAGNWCLIGFSMNHSI